jgi:hypothetical protein
VSGGLKVVGERAATTASCSETRGVVASARPLVVVVPLVAGLAAAAGPEGVSP